MFKVFVINDYHSMRSLRPSQSYHMIVCQLRCFSHYPARWPIYSTKCKYYMFSTKAAMNHFHTLPESPQFLIFHLNHFGCWRFRNISQLTNYWQLPHSVIWLHAGSSPNLRYWCLDQNCIGRSKSQQPQGMPGFFLYSDRCGGYKDLSIGRLQQRWQPHREDAECKWVLLTLALDQGSSVFSNSLLKLSASCMYLVLNTHYQYL